MWIVMTMIIDVDCPRCEGDHEEAMSDNELNKNIHKASCAFTYIHVLSVELYTITLVQLSAMYL
jgi:hypothetical protein